MPFDAMKLDIFQNLLPKKDAKAAKNIQEWLAPSAISACIDQLTTCVGACTAIHPACNIE